MVPALLPGAFALRAPPRLAPPHVIRTGMGASSRSRRASASPVAYGPAGRRTRSGECRGTAGRGAVRDEHCGDERPTSRAGWWGRPGWAAVDPADAGDAG